MYSTTVYLYQQKQQVLLIDITAPTTSIRWKPVYAKNLKLSLGTDNVVLFSFLNQDQKAVNINGLILVFRLIDQTNETLILSKPLEITDHIRGRARLVLTDSELSLVNPQIANYTIEKSNLVDQLNQPVFVDDYAESRGICEIVDQIMPKFSASTSVTIPDHSDDIYYSSQYLAKGIKTMTIQYQLDNFNGTIQVQGAIDDSGRWYDIVDSEKAHSSDSGSDYINVLGIHTKIRLKISKIHGTVTDILIR